jgi:hypothetical protein
VPRSLASDKAIVSSATRAGESGSTTPPLFHPVLGRGASKLWA